MITVWSCICELECARFFLTTELWIPSRSDSAVKNNIWIGIKVVCKLQATSLTKFRVSPCTYKPAYMIVVLCSWFPMHWFALWVCTTFKRHLPVCSSLLCTFLPYFCTPSLHANILNWFGVGLDLIHISCWVNGRHPAVSYPPYWALIPNRSDRLICIDMWTYQYPLHEYFYSNWSFLMYVWN